MIGGLVQMRLGDSSVYWAESYGAIQEYSQTGRYIRQYGSRGKGPGEYLFGGRFEVDEESNVYVLETTFNKVLKYDFSGDYVKGTDYSCFLEDSCRINGLIYAHGKLFLKADLSERMKIHYSWILLDTLGNKSGERINEFDRGYNSDCSSFYKLRHYIGYWNPYCDTVFEIDESGIYKTRYLWKKGDFRLPLKSFGVKLFRDRVFWETSAYCFLNFNELPNGDLFAQYYYDEHYYSAHFNKLKNKWYYCKKGFLDDITGFLYESAVWPAQVHSTSLGNFILQAISPLGLKQWGAGNDFKNIKVKTPHFKQQLKELADRLDDNDNWVVVAYRLKE